MTWATDQEIARLRADKRHLSASLSEATERAGRLERDLAQAREEARRNAINIEGLFREALDERTRRIVEFVRACGDLVAMGEAGEVNPDHAELFAEMGDRIEEEFPR